MSGRVSNECQCLNCCALNPAVHDRTNPADREWGIWPCRICGYLYARYIGSGYVGPRA